MILFRHLLLFTILAVLAVTQTNATPSPRLIARCSSHGLANSTWWKYDSLDISYASSYGVDYYMLRTFTAPYLGNWRNNIRADYYYSATTNPDSVLTSRWDGMYSFMPYSKTVMHTNSLALVDTVTEQNWQPSLNSYVNTSLETFIYDGINNRVTEHTSQTWDTATQSWQGVSRISYTRDPNGVTGELRQVWDVALMSWVNVSKIDTTHDMGSKAILMTASFKWVPSSASWQPLQRSLYNNSSTGISETSSFEEWDSLSSAWVQKGQYSYTHDGAWNLTSMAFSNYQASTNSYDPVYLDTFTYNGQKQMTSAIRLYRQGGTWAITTAANREVYYYEPSSPAGTQATNISGLEFKMFPVPSNASLYFSFTSDRTQSLTLTIADINGRVYQQTRIASASSFEGKLSTEKLPVGNYVLLIQDGNGNSTTKSFTVMH